MNTKFCYKCKLEHPVTDFYKNKKRKDGLNTACKKCHKLNNKEQREKEPAHLYDLDSKYKHQVKEEVYQHYCKGKPKCMGVKDDGTLCEFDDMRALSIDHINSDGAEQRKVVKSKGIDYYRWIKKNDYPSDLQVLCMNCQWIKRHRNKEHNKHKSEWIK